MTHSGLCVSSISPGGVSEGETLSELIFHGASLWQYVHMCVFVYAHSVSSRKQRNETIKYSANEPGTVSKAHAYLECNTIGHMHIHKGLWRKIQACSLVKHKFKLHFSIIERDELLLFSCAIFQKQKETCA